MKKEKSKKKNMPQEKFQSLQECKEHIVRRLALKKNMPQEKFQSLQECKEHIVRRLAFQIEKIQSEADTIRFILESVDMRISQWKKDKKRMCINGIGELQGTARTFEYLCTEISLLEEVLNKFELEENHENIPHSPTN